MFVATIYSLILRFRKLYFQQGKTSLDKEYVTKLPQYLLSTLICFVPWVSVIFQKISWLSINLFSFFINISNTRCSHWMKVFEYAYYHKWCLTLLKMGFAEFQGWAEYRCNKHEVCDFLKKLKSKLKWHKLCLMIIQQDYLV